MSQRGSHTWEIVHHYHLCPRCKRIVESRQDYRYILGRYIKELECPHCRHAFSLTQKKEARPAPLFGNEAAPEWDWPEDEKK